MIRKNQPHLLHFLYVKGLDAPNNQAKRQLRPAVSTRKTTGCNGANNHAFLSTSLDSRNVNGTL